MVGEHLGVVFRAPKALDPLCDAAVLLGTVGAGDLPVGDVANEGVCKRELGLAFDGRAFLAAHESLALERVQGRRRVRAVANGRRPEHLADDGGVAQQILLGVGQPVEAGRDDSLERLGKPELVRGAPFEEELRELLGIEGIATCTFQQRLLRLGGQHGSLQELRDEERRLVLAERRERERRRVELAAAPARAPLEQLRPRGRDRQQRDVGDPVDELVHEVEQALVRPVKVFEDDHEWPLFGHRLEKAPPGRECCDCGGRPRAPTRPTRPTSERSCDSTQFASPVSARTSSTAARELLLDLGRRVLLDDAGLRLDDLRERPERDSVAVGEAAALTPGDELGVGVGDPRQLVHEAALADPRHADEREELRRSLVTCALEGVADDAELALAADKLRARLVRDVDAEARVRCLRLPHGDRLRLALRLDGFGVLVVDGGDVSPGTSSRRPAHR